jgi:hypothetical protein
MKLFIKEGRYEDDMAVARHMSKWLEPDPVDDPEMRYTSAKITVSCLDTDEDYETEFDFDVYNSKKLPNEDFEEYINKNASLLAQQECEQEGSCEFIEVTDIQFEEEPYYEDNYENDDFYDPYEY